MNADLDIDYNAPRAHKSVTAWEDRLNELVWSFDDDQPRFRHEKWRQVFDEQVKATPLSLLVASDDEQLFSLPLAEHVERFEVVLSKEQIWQRFNTLSHIAILEGEEQKVSLIPCLRLVPVLKDSRQPMTPS